MLYIKFLNSLLNLFRIKRRFLVIPLNRSYSPEISICYAITVCDEHEELENLLKGLIPYLNAQDEILIQGDEGNVSDLVKDVVEKYSENIGKYIEFPLNRDFGAFKSNLSKNTKSKYVFQLDADEIPSPDLIKELNFILANNQNIDLIRIPRINVMIDNYLDLMKWNDVKSLTKEMIHNFPDYQRRLYRNDSSIFWTRKLHERIVGNKNLAYLPKETKYCILHCKRWSKQEKWVSFNKFIQ